MRLFFVCFICLLSINYLFSQTNADATFITIGKHNISTSEFERIFNKNNSIATAEKQTVEEYLQMFINFKLKVQAAEDAGFDTTTAFKTELKGYRDQLAKSYLTDHNSIDSLIEEAYQRMHTEVRASHIMAGLKNNASPSDTLLAWNKIMAIRQRLMNGEDFAKLALELSDDPSAKGNNGDLGYFTAFQMVYPFESAAFNTRVGEISLPVRSRFGYHVLKVTDKRPAQGEVKVAHIMLMVPQGSPDSSWVAAEKRIKEIEQQLKSGADFSTLAREKSEDRGSARNGGELPVFGTGRMVPEFEGAAFKLQYPGDISAPVRTFYGWHLIKLIEKKSIPEFEQVKQDIKSKIARDERAEYGSISFVNSLKKEYGFTENKPLLKALFQEQPRVVTVPVVKTAGLSKPKPGKTLVKSKADAGSSSSQTIEPVPAKKLSESIAPQQAGEILFQFAGQQYNLEQFGKYLKSLPQPDSTVDIDNFVNNAYHTYVKNQMLAYEDSQLENKYPDFKNLVEEYHDGILLFNLSDSLVWSKASKDSSGLENFFKSNQSNYQWPQRLEATFITCNTKEVADKASKAAKKLKTPELLEKELTKTICDTALKEPCCITKYDKYVRGDHPVVDSIAWKKGISPIISRDGKFHIVVIHNLLKPEPKTLEESKGMAISDYQNALDKEWVSNLRRKYTVTVNNEILNQLKTKYESKK